MSERIQKLLLILTILALATSPLRGAFAAPVMATEGDTSHCVQMHDGMQSPDHLAEIQESSAVTPGHDCDQGCDRDCCDGACNACVHVSIALPDFNTVSPDNQFTHLYIFAVRGGSSRTVLTPFRPPIRLS